MSSDQKQRKLSPIYSAIEDGHYKNAVKLCQKKDISTWDITKALLAYSLMCMSRKEEALLVAREVKEKNPTDEVVLNTLYRAFKGLGAHEDAIGCYEDAFKTQPDNEEIGVELFFAYVRKHESKKQQAIAMKLFKSTSKARYIFWAVTSILQQSDITSSILSLGEKMIKKVLSTTNPPGAEELQLYMETIQRQDRAEDALHELKILVALQPLHATIHDDNEFLADTSSVKLHHLQAYRLECGLLKQLRRWGDLVQVLLEILTIYPDHWEVHADLVDAYLTDWGDEAEAADERIRRHLLFLRSMQDRHSGLRGPFLAELRVLQCLVSQHRRAFPLQAVHPRPPELHLDEALGSEEAGDSPLARELVCAICVYWDRFGDRVCCFSDLQPYLKTASDTWPATCAAVRRWAQTKAEALLPGWGSPESLSSLDQRPGDGSVVRLVKLQQLANATHSDPTQAAAEGVNKLPLVLQLWNGPEGDGWGGREELLALLSLAYRQLTLSPARSKTDSEFVRSALSWAASLRFGLACRPKAFILSLSVLEPLRRLCAAEPMLSAYNALGVKYVQTDSMSYLVLPGLLEAGFVAEAVSCLRAVLHFHSSASRDTAEMVAKAFRHSNCMKVLDLWTFVERCKSSVMLALARAELPLLQVADSEHTSSAARKCLQDWTASLRSGMSEESEEELQGRLRDNSDYCLLPDPGWKGSRAEDSEVRFRQMKDRVLRGRRLQVLVLQLLQGEAVAAEESLAKLKGAVACTTSTDDLEWSQRVDLGDESFGDALWSSTVLLLEVAVKALKPSSQQRDSREGDQQPEGPIDEYLAALSVVRQGLLQSAATEAEAASSFLSVRPGWLRKVSAFRIGLASIGPLLVECCPKSDGTKKKKGKKASTTSGGEDQKTPALVTALVSLASLMDDAQKALIAVQDKILTATVANAPLPFDGIATSSGVELISKISTSHSMSCERLLGGLRDKLIPLQEALASL